MSNFFAVDFQSLFNYRTYASVNHLRLQFGEWTQRYDWSNSSLAVAWFEDCACK